MCIRDRVILAPFLAVLALAVKLGSPGPCLYRGSRVGWHGKKFSIIKLRTMVSNADRMAGGSCTASDDQRITRIGRSLRRYKLDEIPQPVSYTHLDVYKRQLGKIHYLYSSRLNLGKLRTEENILWSFAPHDIAAILYLLGEEPVSVSAQGGSYLNPPLMDTTLSTLEFGSGAKGHIFVSWLHPFKEQKLTVVGSQKMVVFDDTLKTGKLMAYCHSVNWRDGKPVAENCLLYTSRCV